MSEANCVGWGAAFDIRPPGSLGSPTSPQEGGEGPYMLLAIDAGNTNIVFAVYDGKESAPNGAR